MRAVVKIFISATKVPVVNKPHCPYVADNFSSMRNKSCLGTSAILGNPFIRTQSSVVDMALMFSFIETLSDCHFIC